MSAPVGPGEQTDVAEELALEPKYLSRDDSRILATDEIGLEEARNLSLEILEGRERMLLIESKGALEATKSATVAAMGAFRTAENSARRLVEDEYVGVLMEAVGRAVGAVEELRNAAEKAVEEAIILKVRKIRPKESVESAIRSTNLTANKAGEAANRAGVAQEILCDYLKAIEATFPYGARQIGLPGHEELAAAFGMDPDGLSVVDEQALTETISTAIVDAAGTLSAKTSSPESPDKPYPTGMDRAIANTFRSVHNGDTHPKGDIPHELVSLTRTLMQKGGKLHLPFSVVSCVLFLWNMFWKMASKRRNMFHKNKTQETTENDRWVMESGTDRYSVYARQMSSASGVADAGESARGFDNDDKWYTKLTGTTSRRDLQVPPVGSPSGSTRHTGNTSSSDSKTVPGDDPTGSDSAASPSRPIIIGAILKKSTTESEEGPPIPHRGSFTGRFHSDMCEVCAIASGGKSVTGTKVTSDGGGSLAPLSLNTKSTTLTGEDMPDCGSNANTRVELTIEDAESDEIGEEYAGTSSSIGDIQRVKEVNEIISHSEDLGEDHTSEEVLSREDRNNEDSQIGGAGYEDEDKKAQISNDSSGNTRVINWPEGAESMEDSGDVASISGPAESESIRPIFGESVIKDMDLSNVPEAIPEEWSSHEEDSADKDTSPNGLTSVRGTSTPDTDRRDSCTSIGVPEECGTESNSPLRKETIIENAVYSSDDNLGESVEDTAWRDSGIELNFQQTDRSESPPRVPIDVAIDIPCIDDDGNEEFSTSFPVLSNTLQLESERVGTGQQLENGSLSTENNFKSDEKKREDKLSTERSSECRWNYESDYESGLSDDGSQPRKPVSAVNNIVVHQAMCQSEQSASPPKKVSQGGSEVAAPSVSSAGSPSRKSSCAVKAAMARTSRSRSSSQVTPLWDMQSETNSINLHSGESASAINKALLLEECGSLDEQSSVIRRLTVTVPQCVIGIVRHESEPETQILTNCPSRQVSLVQETDPAESSPSKGIFRKKSTLDVPDFSKNESQSARKLSVAAMVSMTAATAAALTLDDVQEEDGPAAVSAARLRKMSVMSAHATRASVSAMNSATMDGWGGPPGDRVRAQNTTAAACAAAAAASGEAAVAGLVTALKVKSLIALLNVTHERIEEKSTILAK
ncbi:hypothetical protein AAG570_001628 [Ranatra chinensis]|uniref:Uncharacterized protein n=1 Tax=Ranatra chinensis TaxID=642074 RepID=A0ABD0Y925_9HEMI